MNAEERRVSDTYNSLHARIHHEYRRYQLELIRRGLREDKVYSSTKGLVDLEDNLMTMLNYLREFEEDRLEEIRLGKTHEDYDACYAAATEIKMLGEDGAHYKEHLATIVDSGLSLYGKAQLLGCRGRMNNKKIKEALGELPPGWEEDEDEVE